MECTEADLVDIGRRVREALAAEAAASEQLRCARNTFLEEVAHRNASLASRRPSRQVTRRWLPLVFAASLGAGAAGVWLLKRPVSFEVGEARPGRLGDVIESVNGRSTPVHFGEGSSLLLHEGGRMRVLSLASETARVLVESGVLDVSIAHQNHRKMRWDFEAGPYHVVVTGTKFQMAFYPSDQSLSLSIQEGQVTVSGGCQKTPRIVSAGERVGVSCPTAQVPPPWSQTSADVVPAPDVEPEVPPSSDGAPEGTPAPSAGRTRRGDMPWRELLAAGRLSEGLHAAERGDFQRVCRVATAKELLALADAARLFGPYARAVTALRTLRQRFPGSMEAATAAFTLGRIAFERQHAYDEAAGWFESYLREQPTGPLMGDSFGRLMEARLRSGDHAAARANAQQYLRRFPEGPYASEARGILSR
jgi:transmembrane sensor